MNITTFLTIFAVAVALAAGSLAIGKTRRRGPLGRPPIEIDFDRAKRMENKLR